MPLALGRLPRQATELSLGSYDIGIEDAQNPNPTMAELTTGMQAGQGLSGLMPPPRTSPKRRLEATKTPSPKKACLEARASGADGARASEESPPGSGALKEGMSPGPSLSERSEPAKKPAKRGKSPTYWRPDLQRSVSCML